MGRVVCGALLSLILVSAVHADEGSRFEVQTWRVDGDERHSGIDLGARIDLGDELRLQAFASATRSHQLGYGELTWGDLRLGGGGLGRDAGLHVGYRPSFEARLHERLRVRTTLDLALGAATLAGRSVDSSWGADVYAGSFAVESALAARPWRRLDLGLGAYVDATLAVGPPGSNPVLAAGVDLAERLDLGLFGALSQGAVGGWGQAELLVLGSRRSQALSVRYREAWDWIHLDPTAAVLDQSQVLEDLTPEPAPPRATRTLALAFGGRWKEARLELSLDAQHVTGSTTSLSFADRDGWSVGLAVRGGAGVIDGSLAARHHFDDHPLEDLWGDMPRTQVAGELGALLYESEHVSVRMVGAGRYTLADGYGLPRDGYMAAAALSISFGGSTPRFERGDPSRVIDAGQPLLSQVTERRPRRGLLQRLLADDQPVDLPDDDELDADALDLLEVSEEELLALGERLEELSEAAKVDRDASPAEVALGVLRARRPALATGYGRHGVQLAPVRRASRHAVTARGGVRASELGVLTRFDPLDSGNVAAELTRALEGEDLSEFSTRGVDALSVFRPRGRRYELAYQGRSAWSRFMRRVLSGR